MSKNDPYESCPVYESEHFILRLVSESDADDLLECYSNTDASKFFNSDNCDYGFDYHTLTDMKECIRRWLEAYKNKAFIRFAILDRQLEKTVGTIEIFARAGIVELYRVAGVLRIDLLPDYEKRNYITEILKISNENFYAAFNVVCMITKAIPEAIERRSALTANGFSMLEDNKILPYGDYYIR